MTMSKNRPCWFLDIDGVINSFPAPRRKVRDERGDFVKTDIIGFPIWYSRQVVDFINRMNKDFCDVVWLTTWRDRAPTHFAPAVGLDDFPAITDRTGSSGFGTNPTRWWKYQRVLDWIGSSGTRFVWTDDDIGSAIKDVHVPENFEENQFLVIKPWSCPGLTPEDLLEIESFLKNG